MTDEIKDAPPAPGPEQPTRKIAIVGSAISSLGRTPFDDPGWEIWACSPANRNLKRVDVWFELHNVDVKIGEGLSEWIEWLKKQPLVYMQTASPEFPGAKEYPLLQMVEKYGRHWWTSQVSYMLALAIEQNPKVIGIYGIDMAAQSEYNQQRAACQWFIEKAEQRGIVIAVPPESDLLEPAPMYGYCESSRRWRKYYARKQELLGRVNDLTQREKAANDEKKHLIGALDDMEYHLAHWANTTDFE